MKGMIPEAALEGATWRKATRSNTQGNQCVEIAMFTQGIAVRDSKDPNGPKLMFTAREWDAFLEGVKGGEFDLA
ncbi:DUF397 domain-containing protein [Streptosporangiaceae bacterium NEAU-GS5]|nr:DUF397 domain-containing protein [Streptosporangiaceae bacterium NEAU-GS5]